MTSKRSDSFLKDLEGLRAIAVLAVLIFHVDENLLPGGFLGVDLFFVISGYVVSKVLISGGVKGQLLDFYLNRFHRLIPASAVTILATIVLFEVFANQLTNDDFYISALSSIFSFANINFYLSSGYWSDELSVNPFLHFWSLSVEEQFYLIWPAILYVVAIRRPRYALKALIALLLLSIALLYMIDTTGPSASFYLMPSRIFQFSAGALAFYLSGVKGHIYLRESSFIVGILSFLALVCLVSGDSGSILINMITPTIASFLILFGLQTQTSIFSLSSFPFRYIGRISYSLYLVHWPIIILLKINYGSTLIIQGLAIVLSFFFAYVLHEKIEKKCRLHKIKAERAQSFWPKRKSLVNLGLFSSSIFVILIGIYTSTMTTPIKIDDIQQSTAVNSSFKANIKSDNKNIWTCQTYEKGVLNGESKYKLSTDLNLEQCLEGKYILLGDSWGPEAAEVLFSAYGAKNVATLNSAGCRPLPPKEASSKAPDFHRMNTLRFDMSLLSKYKHIFISSNWHNQPASNLDELIDFFRNSVSVRQSHLVFSKSPW